MNYFKQMDKVISKSIGIKTLDESFEERVIEDLAKVGVEEKCSRSNKK